MSHLNRSPSSICPKKKARTRRWAARCQRGNQRGRAPFTLSSASPSDWPQDQESRRSRLVCKQLPLTWALVILMIVICGHHCIDCKLIIFLFVVVMEGAMMGRAGASTSTGSCGLIVQAIYFTLAPGLYINCKHGCYVEHHAFDKLSVLFFAPYVSQSRMTFPSSLIQALWD